MSDQKIDLALAFLKSQPGAAAGILEQQPVERVAEFLSNVPYPHAASVLGKMLPQYATRLIKCMEPATSAAWLSEMDISLVVQIVRHTGKNLCKQLLDLLPEKTSIACRLLLNYSEEAVGAWMVSNFSSIPVDCNVEEALQRIRSEKLNIDTGVTYVIDRDRRIKGILSLATLMQSAMDITVNSLMGKNRESISARTALVTALANPNWDHRDSLPVTNRNQQLVGVLRYLDLRKGLDQISKTITQPEGADPVSGIYEAYGWCLLELFSTVADISRRSNPQG